MHLVGFIIKKFVTMHGHLNVKFIYGHSSIVCGGDFVAVQLIKGNGNTAKLFAY